MDDITVSSCLQKMFIHYFKLCAVNLISELLCCTELLFITQMKPSGLCGGVITSDTLSLSLYVLFVWD